MNEAVEVCEGIYLYSVINCDADLSFGNIGINGSKVFTIPNKDIAAVAHSCKAEAYTTQDNERAKEWVLVHNYVIDRATKQFGTVLPFAFNCLIRGNDETIRKWLNENYSKLRGELDRVRDKAEYSVQIFCDQDRLTKNLMSSNRQLNELRQKMEKMPKGSAYLFQRQFELKLKDAISAEISTLATNYSSKIKEHTEEMKVESRVSQVPEKFKAKRLIVAFSCLVHKNSVEKLGEVLDKINKSDGFAVRFTGPWAPFSFVRLKED